MSKVRHILFDCDGVLVDTEYTAAVKMCQALEEAGISIDLEDYLRVHSGTTFSAILEHYFGDSMSANDKSRLINKVEGEVAAAVKSVAGIPTLLSQLELDKSVVSNSSLATVNHALEVTSIDQYFNGRIFSSEQVARAKPAPDLYLFALKSLDLTAEELIVIEDSRTGVQAARAAGLSVIGFTGASHILPGHEEKLLALGAMETAPNAEVLLAHLTRYLS
jgi:beta-phosphoglucomutase-like phosphatase (HAD superfamily)